MKGMNEWKDERNNGLKESKTVRKDEMRMRGLMNERMKGNKEGRIKEWKEN